MTWRLSSDSVCTALWLFCARFRKYLHKSEPVGTHAHQWVSQFPGHGAPHIKPARLDNNSQFVKDLT